MDIFTADTLRMIERENENASKERNGWTQTVLMQSMIDNYAILTVT